MVLSALSIACQPPPGFAVVRMTDNLYRAPKAELADLPDPVELTDYV
jgi:hypothetical protein